jgi:hypothetical protein
MGSESELKNGILARMIYEMKRKKFPLPGRERVGARVMFLVDHRWIDRDVRERS